MLWEERQIAQQNQEFYRQNQRMLDATDPLKLIPIKTKVRLPEALPKPPAREELPWCRVVDTECQTCGGSGFDSGALDPEGEVCPGCMGRGVETIQRNYLQEAFALISNPNSTRVPERQHLVALTQYFGRSVREAHDSLAALTQFVPQEVA